MDHQFIEKEISHRTGTVLFLRDTLTAACNTGNTNLAAVVSRRPQESIATTGPFARAIPVAAQQN